MATATAAKAAQKEVRKTRGKSKGLVIEFKDHTFEIPPLDDEMLPVEVMEAYEDEKYVTFVRAILGPEQWEAFMETKPPVRDLITIAQEIAKASEPADEQ